MEHPQDPADLIAGHRRRHRIVAAVLLSALVPSAARSEPPQAVETMRYRVVQVSGLESGVGFVVGESDGQRWIVTANHVVRAEADGDPAPQISVRFFDHPERAFPAKPSNTGYVGKPQDLAVLTVDVPADTEPLPPACAPLLEDYRLPVWLIGLRGTWDHSHLAGAIGSRRPDKKQLLAVTIDSVTPGTSGAPLVAAEGVVGMVLGNSGRSTREADALAIGYIHERFLEWRFPWSLESCEAAVGPQRVSTLFPLLPEPPPGVWRNEEARRLFLEGKERLESRDFFCSLPPSFGLLWPPESLDEMSTALGGEFAQDLGVLRSFERSLALEDNRWVRFYRGLALARARAFQPALDDVRSAYEGFINAGELAHAEVASTALERVERWRSEPVQRPGDAPVSTECRTETPTTVCQLLTRLAPAEVEASEPRRLVADIRRLLGGEVAAPGFVAPAVKAQLDCAFELAKDVKNVDVSSAVFQLLLDQARARGLALLTLEYLRAFSRKLLQAGRTAEAESALKKEWAHLTERRRMELLVVLACDPNVAPTSFDAMLALGGVTEELAARLRSLHAAVQELRTLLERLSAALPEAASRQDAAWYLDAVRYLELEEETSWTTEGFVALLPPADRRDRVVASLLAAALRDAGIGADLLARRADEILAELDAIARHAAGNAELRSMHERTRALRKELLAGLAAAGDAMLTAAGAADLVAGLSTLTALDLQVTDVVEDEQELFLVALDKRTSSRRSERVHSYRHAAYLLAVMIQGIFPADPLAEPMTSNVVRKLELRSFKIEKALAALEALKHCADATGAEQRLGCLADALGQLLNEVQEPVATIMAEPILQAHRQAREAEIDALNLGDTRDPDRIYVETLFAELARWGTAPELAKRPVIQQLTLVALAALLKDLPGELGLELTPIVVDMKALAPEAKELVAAVRLFGLGVLEQAEANTLDRAARQARVLLETSTQTIARILVLANPLTYRGLSPEQTAELLAGVRQSGMDQKVMRLALTFAFSGLADGDAAGALGYDQLQVLADYLDDEQFGTLAVQWPLSDELARFSGAIEPLTAGEGWTECEDGSEIFAGLVPVEIIEPFKEHHLLGALHCKCCIHPSWLAPLFVQAAATRERWQKVDELLRDMERRAHQHEAWWGALGEALLELFAEKHKPPADVADPALQLLLRQEVQATLSDAQKIRFAATMVELGERDPPLPSLPPREARLASVRDAGRVIRENLPADGHLDIQSMLEYSERLAAVLEHRKDPLLEWEWTRQTEAVRLTAAYLVSLGNEQVGIGGQSIGDLTKWLEERVAADDPRACVHLGRIRGESGRTAEAADLLTRAATAGDREAMSRLGLLYVHGQGVRADPVLAQEWLRKAVDGGSTEAMVRLGEIFQRGWDRPADGAVARRWFLAAAEAGNPEGMFQLALFDLTADGSAEHATALTWLRQAAEAGHTGADKALRALEGR